MASVSPSSTSPKEEEKEGSAQQSTSQQEDMAPSSSTNVPPPSPSWFTPKRLLVIFCVINMINYVDRGAIASNGVNGSATTCDDKGICTYGSGIQGEFGLTNFQDGLLSSAFMVGLLLASPIFASLAKSHNPFRLIGVGLSVWTLAAVGCGSAFSFWFIAICRMLVGVGEASFISLAAPFIDDNAPVSQKTAWLAMFYMCIPTGVALGYVYGGLVGGHFNWRYAFWGEALLMLPFSVFGFVVKPLQLKGFCPVGSKKALTSVETVSAITGDSEASKLDGRILVGDDCIGADELNKTSKSVGIHNILNQFSWFAKDMKVLLVDKVYVVNVFGYIAYNFVIGAYSYWGPKAGYNIYRMKSADMMFGGITIVCGILGTISGGFILDHMTATISNAFILLSGATFLGAIFCFVAFCLRSLYGFIVLFAVGELLVFATQAPVNYVCLHCVKPSLRPLSMAISTVSIHIFGDVPSSPLVGVLQDHVNNWRETALILTSILFLAAGIWFIASFKHAYVLKDTNSALLVQGDRLAKILFPFVAGLRVLICAWWSGSILSEKSSVFLHSVDKFNDESESQVSTIMIANRKPLLEGNGDESFGEA